jgi:hypothetical protein
MNKKYIYAAVFILIVITVICTFVYFLNERRSYSTAIREYCLSQHNYYQWQFKDCLAGKR